jgi:hypothetical protein
MEAEAGCLSESGREIGWSRSATDYRGEFGNGFLLKWIDSSSQKRRRPGWRRVANDGEVVEIIHGGQRSPAKDDLDFMAGEAGVYSIVTSANAQRVRRPIATDRAFALGAMVSRMTVSMFFAKMLRTVPLSGRTILLLSVRRWWRFGEC